MVNKKHFVSEEDYNKFENIFIRWSKIIDKYLFKESDSKITKKLQDIIEEYKIFGSIPKLNSITKGYPADYMILDKIIYKSNNNKITIEIIFESELETTAKMKKTYKVN